MRIQSGLQEGRLLRRYKRFMADVETITGEQLTLHCPNTGSMKNCCDSGSRVWFWDSNNPKRKYPHTWELVEVEGRHLACINTGRANGLAVEAIESGVIAELQGYAELRTEVKYGQENSRIDILLCKPEARCYVEVKNVTLLRGNGEGAFPDAVSTRGTKHLRELMQMVAEGHRAVLLFCVAHTGIEYVCPADDIDPKYGQTLREAVAAGVEVLAYGAEIVTDPGAEAIRLARRLPVKTLMID